MSKIIWTEQLNIGIEAIDRQHSRIVDYINLLDDAHNRDDPRDEISAVIGQLIDYTDSHFTFEENMLKEANYPLLESHKQIHAEFIRGVVEYQAQFNRGDDVAMALHRMLVIWLFNHIKQEDASYVSSVKGFRQTKGVSAEKKGFFSRMFN